MGGARVIFGLTLGELVNAASGILFVLTGIVVFALARGHTGTRFLGITLALWGMTYPAAYFTPGGALEAEAIDAVVSACFLGASIVVAWRYPKAADRADSIRIGVSLALVLVAWAVPAIMRPAGWRDLLVGEQGPPLGSVFTIVALAFLSAVFALRALRRPAESARLARLTLVFGLYGVYNAARIVVWLNRPGLVTFTLLALNLLPGALWLLVAARGGPSRLARNTALAIAAAGLLGAGVTALVGSEGASQLGVPGALRTACWAILATAILRHGLAGRELPRLAVARGPLAAAALASLFIVAQIAQQFFAAEYGLLMGGLVAGALLFAANPIQRAVERLADHAPTSLRPAAPHAHAEREDAYRQAVRLALRDRVLTRQEERHLLRLAYHLGVPTPRAMEIHDEVERESVGGTA